MNATATATTTCERPIALSPWVVVIDTGEKRQYPFDEILDAESSLPDEPPYTFRDPLRIGAKQFKIQTAPGKLFIGDSLLSVDYSLAGYEDRIGIERKSMADFFGTMGGGRARFERKIELLNATFDHAAVVVEAEWSTIFASPPRHSRLNPKTALCSVLAWQQRFPRVHWHFVPGREVGEVVTVLILDRFYRDQLWKAKQQNHGTVSDAVTSQPNGHPSRE